MCKKVLKYLLLYTIQGANANVIAPASSTRVFDIIEIEFLLMQLKCFTGF